MPLNYSRFFKWLYWLFDGTTLLTRHIATMHTCIKATNAVALTNKRNGYRACKDHCRLSCRVFFLWHGTQRDWRLDSSSVPPLATLTIWSSSKSLVTMPQHWQVHSSRKWILALRRRHGRPPRPEPQLFCLEFFWLCTGACSVCNLFLNVWSLI